MQSRVSARPAVVLAALHKCLLCRQECGSVIAGPLAAARTRLWGRGDTCWCRGLRSLYCELDSMSRYALNGGR